MSRAIGIFGFKFNHAPTTGRVYAQFNTVKTYLTASRPTSGSYPRSHRSKTPPLPTNMPAAADHPVLSRLLSSNAQWSKDVASVEPQFFEKSAKGQAPKVCNYCACVRGLADLAAQVLWIGCADSRVPESVILACKPGESEWNVKLASMTVEPERLKL